MYDVEYELFMFDFVLLCSLVLLLGRYDSPIHHARFSLSIHLPQASIRTQTALANSSSQSCISCSIIV